MRRRFCVVMAAFAVLAITGFAGTATGGVKLQYDRAYDRAGERCGDKTAPGRNVYEHDSTLAGGKKVGPAKYKELTLTLESMCLPPPAAPAGGASSGSVSAGGASAQLEAIAACESGGNPGAIGGGGAYRGKYQFDYGTWASVGGSGDPAAAPEAEQDARAQALLDRSGTSPWPVCGG